MSALIWVQTVCKGNQQMTKVTAIKERANESVEFLYMLHSIDKLK